MGTLVLDVFLVKFCKGIPSVSGHLFALSCARVLLVYLGSVCFCALIFGEVSFISLLFVRVFKWL